jgi:hypothetical protein
MSDTYMLVWGTLVVGGLVTSLVLAGVAFSVGRARRVRPGETAAWRASVAAAGVAIASFFVLTVVGGRAGLGRTDELAATPSYLGPPLPREAPR